MKGVLSAALVVTAALGVAGCGATTATSVALREARDAGGTQTHAVRVERWRISNGDAVDVVLVRARFCGGGGGVSMPKVHGRCLPTEVYFEVRPGETAGGSAFLQHGQAQLAVRAWRARPVFRIFPNIPDLLVRCKIPQGAGGTVAGLCEAKLYGSRKVAFLEHWPLTKPHGQRKTAGWVVTLDRSGRVVSVSPTGSVPPQAQF
jgi:hypothetical protein